MDDLIFKNIPAEGFDPQTGFSDRFSNPTPSRTGSVSDDSIDETLSPTFDNRLSNPFVRTNVSDTSFSGESTRLSNPTPSRRSGTVAAEFSEDVPAIQSGSDPFSRASNPTPTRRGTKELSPFDSAETESQDFSSLSVSAPIDDPCSRASNPTPTRRRSATVASDMDSSSFGVVSGVDVSRASNPTPRRRTGETPFSAPISNGETMPMSFVPDETFSRASNPTPTRRGDAASLPTDSSQITVDTSSLLFSSVTDPYGTGLTEDSRASNPTPTRRVFGSDEAPSDDEYDDSNRLSHITPSSRK